VIIFILWQIGLEIVYTRTLTGITNATLDIYTEDTKIEYKKNDGKYIFEVTTLFENPDNPNGPKLQGTYPQEVSTLMQAFVIILSWQIFLFFIVSRRTAFKSLLINLAIYLFAQVVFLILLTNYHQSKTAEYIFTMMLDSFYIIALILVIKDYMFLMGHSRFSA
jgi:hypothetical protein